MSGGKRLSAEQRAEAGRRAREEVESRVLARPLGWIGDIRLVADEPTAECCCCGRTLPAEQLFIRDDWRFICEPCHRGGGPEEA